MAQRDGKRHHPLTDGHPEDDVIDEMGGRLRHAAIAKSPGTRVKDSKGLSPIDHLKTRGRRLAGWRITL